MPLQFDNGDIFTTGATPYAYQHISATETTPRIIIPVSIQRITISAFVDTGGVYALISPEIVEQLDLDPGYSAPANRLNWRGDELNGVLHRIPITLLADEGSSLTIQMTCFLPKLKPWEQWPSEFSCILGMYLCFDRLRFAIDPLDDMFYFGRI